MAISMYAASVPVFQRMLENLDHVLEKAGVDAAARKIDQQVFFTARLAPDMYILARQVQIACDFAKGTPARLAGLDPPKFEDNEATLADLRARIKKTLDYIAGFKPAQVDGSEGRDISFKSPGGEFKFKGLDYLLAFALPNFFFHYTTAYNILRHNGVKLVKADYIKGRNPA